MRWERLGRLIVSEGQRPWMASHASVPFAEPLEGTMCRLWFTPRDAKNRSYIGWAVVDLARPGTVLELAARPALAPGSIGLFDDRGVMTGWLIRDGDRRLVLYTGWNVRSPVGFHNSVGLAEVLDGEGGPVLQRVHNAPILDRAPGDPYFCSTACAVRLDGRWRVWYLSGIGWVEQEGRPRAHYNIHLAEGQVLGAWERRGLPAIALEHPGEVAVARMSVVRDADAWRAWYSFRGESWPYRLGYADSVDGLGWVRRDEEMKLAGAPGAWEQEMQCYPHVFDQSGERFMVYCGNGYSAGGIGLARLVTN